MKILKIEFQNINSLKGTHVIDFTAAQFTASSLFAITGPTGSGKSTILDVISLALFNHVPRLGKISKNEIISKGAILTRNQKEAFASVTYESKSGQFKSTWSISTARTGNLREYEMQISNEVSDTILDLKKSDVPGKNEELIGLNYNQFIKSVLLAQGEFAQFLKAKKEERGELLEKITGTGIYRKLGRRAFEKYREVNSVILDQQKAIELLKPKLLTEEQQKDFSRELLEKEQTCKPLEKAISVLERNLELKKSIQSLEKDISKLKEEKALGEEALLKFGKDFGEPLEFHEKVRGFSEELRSWNRFKEEIHELHRELQMKKAEETKNLEDIERCLETTGSFTGTEVSAEDIIQKLEAFNKKVSALQEARSGKLNSYENIKTKLTSELRDVNFKLNGEPVKSLGLLEDLKSSSALKIEGFKESLKEIDLQDPENKNRIKRDLLSAREALQQSVKIENLSTEIKKLKSEAENIEVRKKGFPQDIERTSSQVEILGGKLENHQLKRENQLLRASQEMHRSKLKDGEPCPLCGALKHPYAVDIPETDDSLETHIKSIEKELNDQKHQLSTLTARLKGLEDRLQEIRQELLEKQRVFSEEETLFSAQYDHLISGKRNGHWQELCRQYEFEIEQLEKCEKEQQIFNSISTAIPLHRELNAVLAQGKELKKELDSIYDGKDIHRDCQKIQNDWIGFSREQNSLKKQQKELTSKLNLRDKNLEELEHQLKPLVDEQGFKTIDAALAALLPDQEFHKLNAQREKIKTEISRTHTSLGVLNSQLEEYLIKDSGKDTEELIAALEKNRFDLDLLKKACEELRRMLINDKHLQQELEDLRNQIAEKGKDIKRWRLLQELIGDSQGKKFNDFAQDLSLSHLLQLANVRLKDLSDRYRIDKPVEEEDDGLVAIDDHMGGQRRSVKTLSGGETFILSLSMALALSDLASRNVEINSLFIDEGFGTLDPETLDQTLDTLEKLQAESSKTIGIISHVDSLKERIATQIQLKRNGQGYSSLIVRG